MCGVCGFATAGNNIDTAVLTRMMDAIVHRGPDDAGMVRHEGIGLGFRRLSILDVGGGHQPMSGEDDRVWAVTNGEIYNYQEIREDLIRRGHRFRSHSDAEVVPHLYEEEGIEGLSKKLRGMFAIAIMDRAQGTLYLVRDHFGIKPLYYAMTPAGVLFASEIKGLLASHLIRPEVDLSSLWHYLSFQYVPDPGTMLQGVYKVPPGHFLTVKEGRASLTRYWSVAFNPRQDWTLPELRETIYTTLKDSVRYHMMSDVPRGAYLSSGIDSSAVVAFLREHQVLDTFSIGFAGKHGEVNELTAARETAQYLDTRHHEVVVTAGEYLSALPKIVRAQEDPIADPSAPALYFLAQEARRHVTVVLSGEGADELFAGYPIYHESYALRPFDFLPPTVRGQVGKWAEKLPTGMKGRGYLTRGALPLEHRFIGNAKMYSEAEKMALLHPDAIVTNDPVWVKTAPYYDATRDLDPVSRMQTVDCNTWLPGDILMKADKMSMAHSLELRVPFLDVKVFELAATIPARFKVANGTTKYALREALRPLLPKVVAERPKLGFPIPIRHWLQHEMRDFAWDLMQTADLPYFNRSTIQSILNANQKTLVNHDRKLWTLIIFALWHQEIVRSDDVSTVCEPSQIFEEVHP